MLDNSVGHTRVASPSKFDHIGHILGFLRTALPGASIVPAQPAQKSVTSTAVSSENGLAPGDDTMLQSGSRDIFKKDASGWVDPSMAVQNGNGSSEGGILAAGVQGERNCQEDKSATAADVSEGSGVGEAAVEALEDAFVREPKANAAQCPGDSCHLQPATCPR